jgi:hypothetical protein
MVVNIVLKFQSPLQVIMVFMTIGRRRERGSEEEDGEEG